MSKHKHHFIQESDFGDGVQLITNLTQQQFHCLRHLIAEGIHPDEYDELEFKLIDELAELGLVEYEEMNEPLFHLSPALSLYYPVITDYVELFTRTSNSIGIEGSPSSLDFMQEGQVYMLRQIPPKDNFPYPRYFLYDGETDIEIPSEYGHLSFFVRNGVHLLTREGDNFYGRRFRDKVTFQIHAHFWNNSND